MTHDYRFLNSGQQLSLPLTKKGQMSHSQDGSVQEHSDENADGLDVKTATATLPEESQLG